MSSREQLVVKFTLHREGEREEESMNRLSQVEDDEKTMWFPSLQSSICITLPNKGGEESVDVKGRRMRRRKRILLHNGVQEEDSKKRRRLTEDQVKFLEMSFWKERNLESGRKASLASEIGIDPKQVAVWFQNRRARSKNKQLEEEYKKLKSINESVALRKCHLESEILNLKKQLSEAQKEIRRLSGVSGAGEMSSRSPSTSFSMDTTPTFHFHGGGIGGEGEELLYIKEYNSYLNMLDWLHLHDI